MQKNAGILVGLMRRCRSYRRFREDQRIRPEVLERLIGLAGLAASAANRQVVRYLVVCDSDGCSRLFDHLSWAGYLTEWEGPEPGQRPPGYVVVLTPTESTWSVYVDAGLAVQNMLLGAIEEGLGCCVLGAFDRSALAHDLKVPKEYEPLLAVAIGVPDEEVVLEPIDEEHGVRYWRDQSGRHHVPKRSVEELLLRRPQDELHPHGDGFA
jgi:nitroreductase